jgi:PPM family protein phosphatase
MWAHKLEFAWRTDRGRVRTHNEDFVDVQADLGLVVVADGVGGANAGEVASHLAAESICARFKLQPLPRTEPEKARQLCEAAVAEANRAVWQLAQSKTGCVGMGTTVVMGFAGVETLAYANVGDSRLYRLRDRALTQLSHDHSFIQEVVDQGFFRSVDDARRYGIGDNILTRALGSSSEVRVSSGLADLRTGDTYLFCTDGLTNMVPFEWLKQLLIAATESPLGPAAEALVHLANERGGTDNITLALMRVGERPSADPADARAPGVGARDEAPEAPETA